MWIEALAAGLVGLALLALVLAPLVAGQVPEAAPQDEPEELDETRRGAALLALKEIEFDRATGKLSDEDYATLKAKYTVEALAALRDGEQDSRERRTENGGPIRRVSGGPDIEELIANRRAALAPEGAAIECPVCGPRPEGDALYCSNCGRRLEGTDAVLA